jgi:hypothetical protein
MTYYHVYLGAKHFDLVQAYSGEHAIQIVEVKFGNPRRYSSEHNYRAVRA